MSEATEGFRALNEYHREQRATGRAAGPAALTAAGIEFESKNQGAHLIVRHAGKRVDFWPGPGKWREFGTKARGYDVESLIAHLTRTRT